jgi:hypothetical protein
MLTKGGITMMETRIVNTIATIHSFDRARFRPCTSSVMV